MSIVKMRTAAVFVLLLLAIPASYADPVKRGPNWIDEECPNNIRIMKIYPSLVNYWDGNKYTPINTNIESDGDGYKVIKGAYKAHWNNKAGFRIDKDGFFLSYKNTDMRYSGKAQSLNVTGPPKINKSRIKFKGQKPIEMEYIYLPTKLKHNIIIDRLFFEKGSYKKEDTLDFTGILEFTDGLVFSVDGAIQGDNFSTSKSIALVYGSDTTFMISPPLIYDSNNSEITGTYEVKKKGQKTWITLKVPMEWLTDDSREYPVIVDPSIAFHYAYQDTFVIENNENSHGSWNSSMVQSHQNDNYETYIMFGIKSSVTNILDAEIELTPISGYTSSGRTLDLYHVPGDANWADDIGWSSRPSKGDKLASYTITETETTVVFKSEDLFNKVNEDFKVDDTSYISFAITDSQPDSSTGYYQTFRSTECIDCTTPDDWPVLKFTYLPSTEIDHFLSLPDYGTQTNNEGLWGPWTYYEGNGIVANNYITVVNDGGYSYAKFVRNGDSSEESSIRRQIGSGNVDLQSGRIMLALRRESLSSIPLSIWLYDGTKKAKTSYSFSPPRSTTYWKRFTVYRKDYVTVDSGFDWTSIDDIRINTNLFSATSGDAEIWTVDYAIDSDVCDAVTGLTSTGVGTDYVALDWDDSTCYNEFFHRYYIYYRAKGTTTWNEHSYKDTRSDSSETVSGLSSGTTYEFKVVVRDVDIQDGADSNILEATPTTHYNHDHNDYHNDHYDYHNDYNHPPPRPRPRTP